MSYNWLMRRRHERAGESMRPQPTVGSGIVVSWAGMRGIVTAGRGICHSARRCRAERPFRTAT